MRIYCHFDFGSLKSLCFVHNHCAVSEVIVISSFLSDPSLYICSMEVSDRYGPMYTNGQWVSPSKPQRSDLETRVNSYHQFLSQQILIIILTQLWSLQIRICFSFDISVEHKMIWSNYLHPWSYHEVESLLLYENIHYHSKYFLCFWKKFTKAAFILVVKKCITV